MNGDFLAGMEKVRVKFLSELSVRKQSLNDAYSALMAEGADDRVIQDISWIAHKVSGSAATLGFKELGRQASRTERLILQSAGDPTLDDGALRVEVVELLRLMDDPS
ncbi:Hpt domain-containing protein [Sulfitobacter sp. CW3]|uniref:Hpt domain-containing protein n=1 Tax=Sulfitobacter sp. CW3 TaxID=2861965 RepID=UPI001C5CE9AE|nr:Hpt domain-containing protein [Sulfitobacter sp. CW3]MBW4961075.1 Hpt domain-containing protein [Sulfitobacter sp. CW3]